MSQNLNNHNHGGQLTQASKQYDIPLSEWIDLSTGISPFTYPLPKVPDECWQRLPETNDGLETAAANYYASSFLLPVCGSQEAIQRLPSLFPTSKIGIVTPAYHSHQHAWKTAGHTIILLSPSDIEESLSSLNILLIVNPTNPNAQMYSREALSRWHTQLSSQNGYLIVDEAFIDNMPEHSLLESKPKSGLIVLRSIGKFFGLAGIRLGFVWAKTDILQKLANQQDDWSVSHPARWAGKIALADTTWQQQQRIKLAQLSIRLKDILDDFLIRYENVNTQTGERAKNGGGCIKKPPKSKKFTVKYTTLFAYFEHADALLIHEALAKKGILTRYFNNTNFSNTSAINEKRKQDALRFGLPKDESEWKRLHQTLNQIVSNR